MTRPNECRHGDNPAECISCQMLTNRPSKLGSAETGGEKAAQQNDELHKAAWELSTWAASINWDHRAKNTAEWLDGLRERIEAVQIFGKPETNFRRTSQNQTVSSGVEGAHEGTTADKSVALAESSLSSPPPAVQSLLGNALPQQNGSSDSSIIVADNGPHGLDCLCDFCMEHA